MNVHYRNKEMYPQIDKPCRCIDTYNRKASVALWVHPFRLVWFLQLESHFRVKLKGPAVVPYTDNPLSEFCKFTYLCN